MVRISDTVVIDVPPRRVWAWLDDLPRHYRDWHPSHRGCRYLRGEHLTAGAVLQVEEALHGRPHSLTLRAMAVEPGRLLRYAGRGFRGAFMLEPEGTGTRFTAQLELGWSVPLLGWLLDLVLRRVLATRIAALRLHVREEGRNLKRILEERRA